MRCRVEGREEKKRAESSVNEVIYPSSGPDRTGSSSTFDVDGTQFHSFPRPKGEVKKHLLCSRRRVYVCTARRQCHLTIACGMVVHYQSPATVPSNIGHLIDRHSGSFDVHKQKHIQNTSSLSSLLPTPLHATITTTTSRCGSRSKSSSASALASATTSTSLPALVTLPDLLLVALPSAESTTPSHRVSSRKNHEKQ